MFTLILELKNPFFFFFGYFFPMETNQMCIKFVFHRCQIWFSSFESDLIFNCFLMWFKTKFPHFMPNSYLIMHNHDRLSCLFTLTTKVKKFKQIYGDKFNTNMKFNLRVSRGFNMWIIKIQIIIGWEKLRISSTILLKQ